MRMMTMIVALVLAFLTAACGAGEPRNTTVSAAVSQSAAAGDSFDEELAKAEEAFASFKSERHLSEGWAAEVRPGDIRDSQSIISGLARMKALQAQLDDLGPSDRVAGLSLEIREVAIEDLRLLLRISSLDSDLSALAGFLRYAPELDTDPETDFGVKTADLRAQALNIAKGEVAELRPRLREGDGDATGAVAYLLREWQFTPQEIGLTAEDLKALGR